jgi:hypothetical protein
MTQKEQAERLIRIDERTERLDQILCGSDKHPGLIEKFNKLNVQHQLVYDRQKNCIEGQKEKKVDVKWLVLIALTAIALVKSFIFK